MNTRIEKIEAIAITAIAFLAIFAMIGTASATVEDITVNESGWWTGDTTTFNESSIPIQDAINNASDGDTINVAAGDGAQTLNVANWSTPATALAGAIRPTVLFDGTTYHMWYTSSGDVYHTSSTDPANFTTGAKVSGLVSGFQDCAFVMKEGNTYYMLNYGDNTEKVFSIFTSDDGIIVSDIT